LKPLQMSLAYAPCKMVCDQLFFGPKDGIS